MPQTITRMATLNDSPRYVAAAGTLRELQANESRLKLEISKVEARLNEDKTVVSREYAVKALLAGNDNYHVSGKSELNSQLMRLREKAAVVRAAIVEQQKIVNDERTTASQAVCEGIRPEYGELLRRMAISLLAANVAALKVTDIRNELDSKDVSIASLPLLTFDGIGISSRDSCSGLAYMVREALRIGALTRDDIPAELRKDWNVL